MTKQKISIVLPCHDEEKNLPLLIPEIIKNIPKKYSYEIICVDDGSKDNTLLSISQLAKKNKNIKAIIFHKNFGHQAALRAGIKLAKGKAVITMDSDFQHPPVVIPHMLTLWQKKFDLIQGQKQEDKTQTIAMMLERKIGYWLWEKITSGVIQPGISDFRLMDKSVVDYLNSDFENDIFFRGAVTLAAKNPILVPYKVGKRLHGTSSYTLKMFVNMFVSGFVSFSTRPLRLATLTGIVIFLITIIFIIFDIIRALATGERIIQGWITGVAITLIVNSILMLYLGVIGEYIGIIFKEVKRRPQYLIEKTINI